MSKYEVLTKYIPMIQVDSIGDWVIDKENDGTLGHTIKMPFVKYSKLVQNFIKDFYDFHEKNKDLELTSYSDILKNNGIELGAESMMNADVSDLSAECVLALIMGAIRAERFYDGALLNLFKSGCILKWLKRLKSMD